MKKQKIVGDKSNVGRQGDLGFLKVDAVPRKAKKIYSGNEFILAYGEATGHHHKLAVEKKGTIEIFELGEEKFIKVDTKALLKHQEHPMIGFKPGTYRMRNEKEFDYFTNDKRQRTRTVLD